MRISGWSSDVCSADLVERRAKYLLIKAESGTLIVHLSMSGSLRLFDAELPAAKHEHVDILLESGQALRYTDPRRFGAMLWSHEPLAHVLLASLGPEQLGEDFDGDRLYRLSRGRRMAGKQLGRASCRERVCQYV